MESRPFEIIDAMKKIIHSYHKIYVWIFHYSIFILLFLWATIIAYSQAQRTDLQTYQEPPSFLVHKVELKKRFENFTQQQSNNAELNIYILQGNYEATGNFIKSNNNLLSYKWYIVPRFFFLYTTVPLPEITQLTWHYDTKYLDIFAKNVVFTDNSDNEAPFKRSQLPVITQGIVDQFNVSCIFKPKILQGICEHYMQNMIEYLFIYDIPKDYAGLQKISDRLAQKWWYQKPFCDAMKKYILYSNDTSIQLEPVFRNCGEEWLQEYQSLQWFIEIQNQFKSNYTENTLYFDQKLNVYKLLSLQQIMYNDLKKNTINDRIVLPYLWFVENILKKDAVPWFYKDFIYWFHNYYLKPTLSNVAFAEKKNLVDSIISTINQINMGSSLVGYTWLQDQIQNQSLLLGVNKPLDELETVQLSTEELFKYIKNLNFITVSNYTIEGNIVSLWGVMYLETDKKGTETIKFTASLQAKDNQLLVQNIVIENKKVLTKVIQSLIENNKRSLVKVYQYLNENRDFYTDEAWEFNMCNILETEISPRSLVECNDHYVYLKKQDTGAPIKYQFTIKDYHIVSLDISDKTLQKEIEKQIQWMDSNKITLANLISFIFDYSPSKSANQTTKDIQETLIITEKFQKYMWIEPMSIDTIKDKENLFMLKFSLGGIVFRGVYDVSNSTLWPLYFYSVFYREAREVVVRNFSISLDDEHKTLINNFVLDPLGYIESINTNAYKAYLKYR